MCADISGWQVAKSLKDSPLTETVYTHRTLTAGFQAGLWWHWRSSSEILQNPPNSYQSQTSASEPAGCSGGNETSNRITISMYSLHQRRIQHYFWIYTIRHIWDKMIKHLCSQSGYQWSNVEKKKTAGSLLAVFIQNISSFQIKWGSFHFYCQMRSDNELHLFDILIKIGHNCSQTCLFNKQWAEGCRHSNLEGAEQVLSAASRASVNWVVCKPSVSAMWQATPASWNRLCWSRQPAPALSNLDPLHETLRLHLILNKVMVTYHRT